MQLLHFDSRRFEKLLVRRTSVAEAAVIARPFGRSAIHTFVVFGGSWSALRPLQATRISAGNCFDCCLLHLFSDWAMDWVSLGWSLAPVFATLLREVNR